MFTAWLLLALNASGCVVVGEDVSTRNPVEVLAQGASVFRANLRHVRARATLSGGEARLAVESPVTMQTSTKRLRLTLARSVRLFAGAVELRPGAQIQMRTAVGDTISGQAFLEPDDDELETEDRVPGISFSVSGVPCEALTLDTAAVDPVEEVEEGAQEQLVIKVSLKVPVYLRPSFDAASVRLAGAPGTDWVHFRIRQKRGQWLAVEYLGPSDAIRIRGWVPRSAAQVLPAGMGFGSMCTGDHETRGVRLPTAADRSHLRFEGTASLPVGTALWARCSSNRAPEKMCQVATVSSPMSSLLQWWEGEWLALALVDQIQVIDDWLQVDARSVLTPDGG